MDVEKLTYQSLAVSLMSTFESSLLTEIHRKIRITFLLSLGLFVMGMATARCILSIGTSVEVALASVWAQREIVSLDVLAFLASLNIVPGCIYLRRQCTRHKQPL